MEREEKKKQFPPRRRGDGAGYLRQQGLPTKGLIRTLKAVILQEPGVGGEENKKTGKKETRYQLANGAQTYQVPLWERGGIKRGTIRHFNDRKEKGKNRGRGKNKEEEWSGEGKRNFAQKKNPASV